MDRKKAYYSDIPCVDIKAVWKVLNNNTGFEDRDIANEFQTYFLTKVGIKKPPLKPVYLSAPASTTFNFDKVSELTISNHLKQLDIGKSSGIDDVSPFVWCEIHEKAACHLHVIFSNSTIVDNYRPISIPVVMNKIFESIMLGQIEHYMTENSYWDKNQFRFKKQKGCQELFFKVTHEISNYIEDNRNVLVLSLDISKAFDTLGHEVLLYKLAKQVFSSCHKNDGKLLITSHSMCKINDSKSFEGKIFCGIPQGTCLGPILFNIFTNDMRDLQLHGIFFRFADDFLIVWNFTKDSEVLNDIQEDLEKIKS